MFAFFSPFLAVLRPPVSSGLTRSLLRLFLVLLFVMACEVGLFFLGVGFGLLRSVIIAVCLFGFLFLLDRLTPSRLHLADRFVEWSLGWLFRALELLLTIACLIVFAVLAVLGVALAGAEKAREFCAR